MSDAGFGSIRASGQTVITPDWTAIDWDDDLPDYGSTYSDFDASNSVFTTITSATGGEQDQEDSGEEWWYAHCNIKNANGDIIGYAAAGYATARNWMPDDATGCNPPGWPMHGAPERHELETDERRKGLARAYLGLYDLDGNMVWCETFLPGTFYGVAQASDGSIIAVGELSKPRKGPLANNPAETPLHYNPGVGSGDNIAQVDCSQPTGIGLPPLGHMALKGYAVKVDLDGNLIWQNAYGAEPNHQEAWGSGGRCYSVAPLSVGGTPAMYVTMQSGGTWGMRIRESNGHVIDRGLFAPLDDVDFRILSTAVIEHGGTTHLAFAGIHYTSSTPGASYYNAFAAHIADADASPFAFTEAWRTAQPAFGAWHQQGLLQSSTDIAFAVDQGQLALIWPVLADFDPTTDIAGGRSIARLRVHRLQPGTATPVWTTDLGEVRAYDLQAGAVQLADGTIGIVSSKWPPPYTTAEPFRYDDLLPDVQQCLSTQYAQWNGDWQTTNLYDYWATDCYLAKLRLMDGANLWHAVFDAEPEVPPTCYPADTRDQECMYRITEAPDGAWVVSGNTSHNFDDAYLAKAAPPCQARHSFEPLPLDAEGRHIIAANTTWSTDMDIYGTIVIPAGIALTIAECTIRFADTEQLAWPTRIVVEPGGKLLLEDATLTSLDLCPNSLWDGIELRGHYFAQQTLPNQGYLNVKNSTIASARAAVLAARGDFNSPLGAYVKESTGGIVHARDARFLNNVYDAVFRPFENRLPNGAVIPNASSFARCEFVTDGGIPVEGLFPNSHVAMDGVRGIPFRGCAWRNTLLGQQPELPSQQGTGIRAVNSSFTVGDDCASLVPLGTPCPPQDLTTSSFTNLHRGVLAVTFKTDRTFSVDNATFTGTSFGIRMEGIQDASITRCQFNVPTPLTPGIVGPTYGVYSDECTGYRIQENHFVATSPSTHSSRKVGLIIKDSGPYHNTFYNNTFDNLYAGSIIEGGNASADEALGLEVKCNDYGLAQPNRFDVALTGGTVRVQKTQGEPLDQQDPSTYGNPAGNRFSLDHEDNPANYDAEADWHVQQIATVVEYFHHIATPGNRTKPQLSLAPDEITLSEQPVSWPTKPIACPSHLDDGGKEVKRLMAEGEHEEYENSKGAYDATKDDGDTYTLLGYVSDPAKSSAQVRNALQSVAPKVSAEVWRAAFERNPPMSAWHITQALLSNSPLQSEVLMMVHDYGLPGGYASMVQAAQDGVNVLTQLEAAIARHGGNKAEALHALGRMSWLDSLNLDQALDSLLLLHAYLPADNHALAASGVHMAKGDYSALEALALAEESASDAPERYTLLKHYAQLVQTGSWAEPDEALRTWLSALGAQRDVQGSAWANAWLHALGEALPEEVIILPDEGPKSSGRALWGQPVQWQEEELLEVFPNPAKQVAYAAFDLEGETRTANLRLLDVHGRLLQSLVLGGGQGIATIDLAGLNAGLYVVELQRDGTSTRQARLVVQ